MDQPVIAVINDDPTFLAVMEDLLKLEGYQPLMGTGGAGAYHLIQREQPALVVLDIRMEQVDAGMGVLQLLRSDPATRDIPVIICSADRRYLDDNGEHLRQQGCEILHKPFRLEDLLTMIAVALGRQPSE